MAKYDLLRKAIFEEQKEKSERNNESPISRQALAEREEKAREREAEKRAAVGKAIADVGIVPAAPRYERQYNMPEIAADNVVPYLREVTLAQKEYDDYVNSQEFQQRKQEAAAKLTQNVPMSEVPRNAPQMMETFEDETSKGLKAKADYYKKLSNDEKTRRITAQDMAEINAMPEEDRKLFERYAGDNLEQISTLTPLDLAHAMEETETELIKKYGAERLAELKESYERYTAEQQAEQAVQSAHDMNDTGVGAVAQNIVGLPLRALGGLGALGGRAFELIDRTGRYPTLAPYTGGDIMSVYGNAVTADTAERIAGDGDSKVRKGLSAGYQMVTSAADSAVRLALAAATGGTSGSLALAGINSFTDTLREASQKGAPPAQAYLMATANAGLEVLTEKVSLDKALDKAKQLGGSDLRKWVLNTLGQAGVEASGEEASYFGSLLAEAAILQGNSEYNQTIGELVASGMSYEEAKAQADKNVWNEALNTLIISAGSGAIMGAGTTAYSDVMTKLGKQGAQASQQEAAESLQAGILPETPNDTTKAQSPDAETAGTPQAGNALTNALDKLAETGNVSNKTVEKILADPAAMEQLSRQTGLDLSQMATASEKRNAVKAAVRQMAGDTAPATLNREGAQSLIEDMGQELAERAPARQETPEVSPERQAVQNAFDRVLGVDTGTDGNYNAINGNPIQGGTENGTGLQGTDGTGLPGGTGTERVSGADAGALPVPGQAPGGMEAGTQVVPGGVQGESGGGASQNDLRVSGELRVSDKLQEAQKQRGTPTYAVRDTTADPVSYEQALTAGRNSDPANGWCVTPKSAQQLKDGNVRTFMNDNGTVGVGIAPDGDIVAVFKNKNGGPPKALDTMMPIAIEQGGDRLDCYGEGLAKLYAKYGFEPVARVEFNKTYANEGWTPDKGEPYIYVMKHNGDSADTVAQKMGTYPKITDDQLAALPTYGKNDYDAALAYRDSLMGKGSPQVADSSGQSTKGGQADTSAKSSVGAADRDFTGFEAYDNLLSDDNVQPRRASDAKNVEVPKVDAYGRDVSENAHNLMNSDIISDRDIDTAKRLIQEGAFGHETQHMDDVRDAVYKEIQEKGLARSVGEVSGAAAKGKLSEYDVAKAQVLLAMVTEKKGTRAADYASDLMVTLSQMATQSGRQLSMFRLFRKMTPEGQLMTVQKSVKNNVEKMIRSGQVKKGFEATIDPELEQDYLNAAKEAGRAKDPQSQKEAQQKMKDVENAIYAAVAAQMPATEKAKWDAWRYMCMLGNVRTQARNLAGNAMFMPYKAVKDKMGALMELAIPQEQRTKSLLTDRELLQWAKQDAKSDMVQDALKYSGKLGDDVTSQKLFDNRKIYDNKALETVRKWTKAAPEVGDMIFKNPYYAKSLAGFLTARGYSAGDITSGKVSDTILDEGRAYAIDEAMKATFNDCNGFSDLFATTLRYKGDSPYGKAANLLGEGIMPFRRTPANIVVRFTEYSPVGLVKTLFTAGSNIKNGKITASTAIDQLASGLTGSAALGLGALLASGIGGIRLRGSDVDDDEKRRGQQTYSLEVGDYSYKIDWAAPANLPLFVGANLYDWKHRDGEDANVSWVTTFIRGMGNMLEPMLSLSCLSSLNDVIQSGRYAEDGGIVLAVLSNMATSYFTQGIPSLARQASQLFQENKQTTFANSADPTIRDIQKKVANIPFLGNLYKTDKVNAWGEKEKNGIGEGAANWMTRAFDAFVNPGTLKKIDNGSVETEIERLNGAQEENVSPPEVSKTVSYTGKNGEVHKNQRLTEEEYQKLATTQGQTAYRIVSQMIGSKEYAAMTDQLKAQAVKMAYEYAKAKGLSETFPDYAGMDGWKRGIDGKETEAIFRKIVTSEFSKAFDTMEPEALDQAYGLYKSLPAADQADFRKETGGKVGYYITAKEAGVSDKAFTGLYGTYKELGDNSNMTNNQKAQEWSRTLAKAYEDGKITKAGYDALKEKMAFRQSFPIDTEKFDAMTESGLSSDVADRIIKGLADLQGTGSVDKDTGEATVTNRDKWGYIAALDGLSDKEKDRVMLLYMPDYDPEAEKPNKTELKYAYLRGRGYSAEQFTQTYSVTQEFTKKADMIAAWVALGYSSEEAQMFYKLYKGKLV